MIQNDSERLDSAGNPVGSRVFNRDTQRSDYLHKALMGTEAQLEKAEERIRSLENTLRHEHEEVKMLRLRLGE